MSQITVRGLSPEVEREIRRRAARDHRSINQTIQFLLREALGLDDEGARRRNLAHLAGTWSERDAEEFDRVLAVFDQIDPEIWK